MLVAKIGKSPCNHIFLLLVTFEKEHHRIGHARHKDHVNNLVPIHVQLNQNAENNSIYVSQCCTVDAVVHDPSKWELDEEHKVESNEV